MPPKQLGDTWGTGEHFVDTLQTHTNSKNSHKQTSYGQFTWSQIWCTRAFSCALALERPCAIELFGKPENEAFHQILFGGVSNPPLQVDLGANGGLTHPERSLDSCMVQRVQVGICTRAANQNEPGHTHCDMESKETWKQSTVKPNALRAKKSKT